MRRGYVYILASGKNGTLYIGVTNNLSRRVYHHKIGRASEFTRRYGISKPVWYEDYPTVPQAIAELNFAALRARPKLVHGGAAI